MKQMAAAERVMVVSAQSLATKTALHFLRSGGNAMDAFVAAALMEHVVAPGTISLAGAMGLLYYDAKSGRTYYLDAGFDKPRNFSKSFDFAKDHRSARSALVPGIVAGLEAGHKRFGGLPWKSIIQPAIRTAEDGFSLDYIYAAILKSRTAILEKSDYGKKTFFKEGKPLSNGDTLRQPVLAQTLTGLSQEGAPYFYSGAWSSDLVKSLHEDGGWITARDIRLYKPLWTEPLTANYRGYEIQMPNLPASGGITLLSALKIMEHFNLAGQGDFTTSVDSLFQAVQTFRIISREDWSSLTKEEPVDRLGEPYASRIARQILEEHPQKIAAPAKAGPHSSHLIIVDEEGNIATGSYTIESLPWGDSGIFVGGIPINTAGSLALQVAPGGRNPEPMMPYIVFKNRRSFLAGGTVGSSLFPGSLQILINLMDFHYDVQKAILSPRFGGFVYDLQNYRVDASANTLDKRFPQEVADALGERGIRFSRDGIFDTGFAFAALLDHEKHKIYGMTEPTLNGSAEGY